MVKLPIFFTLRLKTKLVLAITSMVVAVVAVLSSIFIEQLVRQRVDEAFQNGEFVSLEVFQSADRAFIPSGVKIPNALETKRHGGPKGQTSTAPPVSHRWNQCEINVRYVAFVNPNAFAQRLELANELRFVVHGHDDFG